MLWTAKDAAAKNSRVKGSPKLQKQWAAVANRVLAAELKQGSGQKEAEGRAIAAANAAVAKKPKAHSPGPKTETRTVTPAVPVVRAAEALDLRLRLAPVAPATLDEEQKTVRATLGTDAACLSIDLRTNKPVLEVYLMSGMEPVNQVPLCDTHKRDSIDRVKGSVREIVVGEHDFSGVLVIDPTEQAAWSKIRNRHVTNVSAGFQPLETTEVKPGQSQTIAGRSYTAPAGQPLFVHTRWRLRETSLTPIGSDQAAKIRSNTGTTMNETIRAWLEANLGLTTDASAEAAQTFWDGLKSEDRQRAEAACKQRADDEDEDEDEDEDDDEEDEGAKKKAAEKKRAAEQAEHNRSAKDTERVRTEALEEGRKRELHRQERIRSLAGSDVPAELSARAISEGWKLGRVRRVFCRPCAIPAAPAWAAAATSIACPSLARSASTSAATRPTARPPAWPPRCWSAATPATAIPAICWAPTSPAPAWPAKTAGPSRASATPSAATSRG